jgi:hypothetical protein
MVDELERGAKRASFALKLRGSLDALDQYLAPEALEEPRASILAGKSIQDWIERLEAGMTRLDALIAFDADRRDRPGRLARALKVLEEYEDRLAKGERLPVAGSNLSAEQQGEWWAALVEFTATQLWIRECESQHPVLLQFSLPEVHENVRRELGELLDQKKRLEVPAIQEHWRKRQLEFKNRPWPRLFQLTSSRKNRAPRLREAIVESLPNGLLTMRPCWLVNPEAAAQIFPLVAGLFDVVIFDEASQCPIEQAVPAIHRGKRLIVAGDEKQLPPTDFFSSRPNDPTDEEDGEDAEATDEPVKTQERRDRQRGIQFVLDLEDLLEAANASLLRCPLLVHYRSQHPDLIAFSNDAFYGGLLEFPPSRHSSQSDYRPIAYPGVGGQYANRTNRQEGAEVVKLLKTIWLAEGPAPTLGVVTFNQPQREMIQDMIEEECQRDDAFAVKYEEEKGRQEQNQDVGFFGKNLENVQGDERDVMIFSTTFGPDASGRFYRRFGPVGERGGERRLNVAVTRARQRVYVVGSMPIDKIAPALQTGDAPGAGLTPAGYLQLYLAYAKAISEANLERRNYILDLLRRQSAAKAHPKGDPESPLEEEVRHALEKRRLTVHPQVGESGFRIDLAILHPNPALGYMLGIECDGATYHSDRAARIPDVWRERILRDRGWRLHRVWSTRWWWYRNEELEKLDQALEAAKADLETTARRRAAGSQ